MAGDYKGRVLQIEGLAETLRRLEGFEGAALGVRTGHVLKRALRQEMVPAMQGVAQAMAKTGRLWRAMDVRKLRTRPGELIAFKVGPSGKRGPDKAWYAHMVVGGTKPHVITPRGRARLSAPTPENPKATRASPASRLARSANRSERGAMALVFGGLLVRYVRHPGAAPNDFYIRHGLTRVPEVSRHVAVELAQISAIHQQQGVT